VRTFDTVFDSQRVFRCLLEATAQPGKLFMLPPFKEDALEAVARTLLDREVTFCAVGTVRETEERLSLTTGARIAPLPEADFVLVSGSEPDSVALKLKRGSLERPEEGATAIYAVERFSNDGALTFDLSGPGVPGGRTLGIEGLPAPEAEALRASRAAYPLGVDVYLIDGAGQIAGLPRSTRLEVGAKWPTRR
jgi:alpha-D-ribose 1-methylphosphonate 5-triphosphate synthase subunit PhnH